MSQSPTAPANPFFPGDASDTETVVEDEGRIQTVLAALDDADCRTILEATDENVLSATEISEVCHLPPATTYRKLEMLSEAGLLEERTRISLSGKHPSEYVRRVDEVVVSLAAGGRTTLQVTPRDTP
ncbi:helix-turn-helix domain-containing protein [Halobacteriaceae archaeon GCM10025711]